MSSFPQSPLYVIESALEHYLDAAVEAQDFLAVIEHQYDRACGWLENLSAIDRSEFDDVDEMHTLGFEGNTLMVEALETLHQAVSEEDEGGLDKATELLCDGHDMVERSFDLCQEIELEADELIAVSLSDSLA